jgi:hypothetical protein
MEAAAAGVELGPQEGAWRLDILPPGDVSDDEVARLQAAYYEFGARVVRLRGSRLLLVGPSWWGDAPPGPHQTDRPLSELVFGPFGGVAKAARTVLRPRLAWPWGTLGDGAWPPLPGLLGLPVTVVTPDGGAVAGLARLLGCDVRSALPPALPDGYTVVHVPDPDEAAHARDPAAKVGALEAVDALAGRLAEQAGVLVVCPDHGCDPATGAHTADPVPALVVGAGQGPGASYSERAAADLPVVDPADRLTADLLAACRGAA